MKTKVIFPLLFLLVCKLPSLAVNHIITFPNGGLTYKPNDSLTVEVGDTVTWEGPFSSHPLESDSVPPGANMFGSGTGTSFSYVVAVPGYYSYICVFHVSSGMKGEFTATSPSTGIRTVADAGVKVYPLVTDDVVNVSVSNNNGTAMHLELLDAKGTLVHKVPVLANGANPVSLAGFSKGVYFVMVRNDDDIVSVTKVVKQ